MATEVTDISEARKKKGGDDEQIWECPECACGLFWCLVDGPIVCANCGCAAENILVTEI